jgi:hypothetical protein
MNKKLRDDLVNKRVEVVADDTFPFTCSPLGFVPKHDGGFRRIHHLSHPPDRSTNDGIPLEARSIQYTSLNDIFDMLIRAGRGCTIIKKDIKDAFRNIPVAPQHQWLLGFFWKGYFIKKDVSHSV